MSLSPSYFLDEAQALLPVVLSASARALEHGLSASAASLPVVPEACAYERRRRTLPEQVPAGDLLRLAAFRSAPAAWHNEVEQACAKRVRDLRMALWPLMQAAAARRMHYRRGKREYSASPEQVREAAVAWLCDAVQVARAVLACPVGTDFVAFATKFALVDSHGFQGRADRILDWEQLFSDEDRDTLAAPDAEEEVLVDAGDLTLDFGAQLVTSFLEAFPLQGVALSPDAVLELGQTYLACMARTARAGQALYSQWNRLKLPHGRAGEIAAQFGLRLDQERKVRGAFEAALAGVRDRFSGAGRLTVP